MNSDCTKTKIEVLPRGRFASAEKWLCRSCKFQQFYFSFPRRSAESWLSDLTDCTHASDFHRHQLNRSSVPEIGRCGDCKTVNHVSSLRECVRSFSPSGNAFDERLS